MSKSESVFKKPDVIIPVIVILIVGMNLITAGSLKSDIDDQDIRINSMGSLVSNTVQQFSKGGNPYDKDLSNVVLDLDAIKSTGASVAAVFPVENIKTADDALRIILPTGTPEYGPGLGVSFDDPINSLAVMARMENTQYIKLTDEELQRYLNLVTRPLGISCEFCCGLKYVGVRDDGTSSCGCQHNPALLTLVRYLIQNTDYSDAEILREAMRWKALFFPRDMIKLAIQVAGGDDSTIKELELAGMVGGC